MKAGFCSLSLPAGEGGIIELWERRTNNGLGSGFRIISGESIWFVKGVNIFNKKEINQI